MNAFASAAVEAAEAATPVELSYDALVARFLGGQDGASGTYTSAGGVLSEGKTILARRAATGDILMGTNPANDVNFNDALVGGLALSGRRYRRVPNFSRLLTPSDRLSELDNDRHEDFSAVAALFGFQHTPQELASLKVARDFRARVSTFFSELHSAEQTRIAEEQNRLAKERAEKEAITWDTGEGYARNSSVTGSGDGQRLRIKKDTIGKKIVRIETSTGNELTLKQAKRAWDFATQFWHGDKRIPSYNGYASLAAREYRGHNTQVYPAKLKFGCQTVTRKEAERFAATQDWVRATKTGATA